MFNISTLSEEEKGLIRAWASQGADLQEIQKRVSKDLGHTITYLDTRFLVSDLGIDLVKPSEPVEKEEGRLGIDPDIAGYQPTELDLEAFRKRLLELAK